MIEAMEANMAQVKANLMAFFFFLGPTVCWSVEEAIFNNSTCCFYDPRVYAIAS